MYACSLLISLSSCHEPILTLHYIFLGCLNVVRKPLRLLAVLLLLLLMLMLLMLLLESNFITRDRLDLGENFKKHLTPLIFMNFWKLFEKISKKNLKMFEKVRNFSVNPITSYEVRCGRAASAAAASASAAAAEPQVV